MAQPIPGAAEHVERRTTPQPDRRKRSRSGRRGSDPHEGRRRGFRVVWAFAAYLVYVGVRAFAMMIGRLRRA